MKLLCLAIEPAPYKVDLFNSLTDSGCAEVCVIYTQERDWSPEGGHDFQLFPPSKFDFYQITGFGVGSEIRAIFAFLKALRVWRPDAVIVSGYERLSRYFAIVLCAALRVKLFFWVDVFSHGSATQGCGGLRKIGKTFIHWVLVNWANTILVCGRLGTESALNMGAKEPRIANFPYVISKERLQELALSVSSHREVIGRGVVLLFSGRLIKRKGFETLLSALGMLKDLDWLLWVEGDGPEATSYKALVSKQELGARVKFFGFCQMDVHAMHLNQADVIVVPSEYDPWGIVVDEGMALGKAVCASNMTGCGLDRIVDGANGFLFEAGNSAALAEKLRLLISEADLRDRLGRAAVLTHDKWGLEYNVSTLLRLMQSPFTN